MNPQFKLRAGIILSLILLYVASNLYYFWIKIAGSIFLIVGLAQLLLLATATILTFTLILKLVKQIEWRKWSNYLTLLLVPTWIIASNVKALIADENTFQSKVKIRACYEGTMNTSRLFLRENNEFEDFNIGFFAHVYYRKGTWQTKGDTTHLKFETKEKHNLLAEKLIIKDELIYRIQADTLVSTHYYLGSCKGLN